jgi:hypothetical protein
MAAKKINTFYLVNSYRGIRRTGGEDEQAQGQEEEGGAGFVAVGIAQDEEVDFAGDFLHDVFPLCSKFFMSLAFISGRAMYLFLSGI